MSPIQLSKSYMETEKRRSVLTLCSYNVILVHSIRNLAPDPCHSLFATFV